MPRTIYQWIGLALWLAGAGHFAVLIASFQVPYRLEWKQDLGKLTPFTANSCGFTAHSRSIRWFPSAH